MSDGRNTKLDMIKDVDVRFVSKIIRYKLNCSFTLNFVLVGFIHRAYMMIVKSDKFSMCKIMIQKLLENIDRIKKTNNAIFRFESFLTCLVLQVVKKFPGMVSYEWNYNKCPRMMGSF